MSANNLNFKILKQIKSALSNYFIVIDSGKNELPYKITIQDLNSVLSTVLPFTSLSDTPATYSGSGTFFVKVNAAGTALEFVNYLSHEVLETTGSVQGDAAAITAQTTVLTPGAAGTGAILPAGVAGESYTVMNRTTNLVNVYPAVGEKFEIQATNDPLPLEPGMNIRVTYANSNWILEENTTTILYTSKIDGISGLGEVDVELPLSFESGSAAAPSITHQGSTSTGIYFPSNGTMGMSLGGFLGLTLDSSKLDLAVSLKKKTHTGITAHAGGGQGLALRIQANLAEITTVASAGDSVVLDPSLYNEVIVYNKTGTSCDVFPQIGGTIDGGGLNVARALTGGVIEHYVTIDGTNWLIV